VKFYRWLVAGLLLALLALALLMQGPRTPDPAPPAAAPPEQAAAPRPAFLPYRPVTAPRPADPAVASPVALPAPSAHALPDEYTLFFADAASMEAFLESASGAGVQVLGVMPGLLAARVRAQGSALAPLLGPGMDVDLNHRVEVPFPPHPAFWENADLSAINASLLEFLGVPAGAERLAWGGGVTIAVLDTGWSGHSAVRDGSVRVIDLLEDPGKGDFSGHGTAVAGMIGSANPFAPGIAPGSDILAVRVLDGEGRGNAFTLAQGILEAVQAGADIINMSLGGYGDSEVLRRAVAYAGERGVLLVASIGNDGIGAPTYPAAYASVIGVTAVDAQGNRTPFANFGEGVDVAAPGYQVHALWEDESFIQFNGTSAAAPLVAGMAARLIETGRAATPEELRQLIRAHANEAGPPGDDPLFGAGILNAGRLENIGKSGIVDIAVADLYPAVEESDGGTFPLYLTFENRGTDFISEASVELRINGSASYYRLSGLTPCMVRSIPVPVPEAQLAAGHPFNVEARVSLPAHYSDSRPDNNAGRIRLAPAPEE
jgi:hypothetical protein